MPLRTDYTNDILDTSKNTERKYNIKNSNGTIVEENVTFEDVTDYEQEGSRFGASDINAITTRVNQLTASDGLDFRFATDGEGNYGYLGADDSFTPFKSKFEDMIDLLWTNPNTGAQTGTPYNISFNNAGYRYLLIEYKAEASRSNSEIYRMIWDKQNLRASIFYSSGNTGWNRHFDSLTDNGMRCYSAYSGSVCIPLRIYGFN